LLRLREYLWLEASVDLGVDSSTGQFTICPWPGHVQRTIDPWKDNRKRKQLMAKRGD
jgi:hypothetical protein